MDIEPIREIARQGGLTFTEHAVRQMARRNIMDTEVQEAILAGEIIDNRVRRTS